MSAYMSAKTTNNSKKSEIRRKSAFIVKSDDNYNKYNFKLYLKPNDSRSDSRSDAITELEVIYDKLSEELNNSELLDRAERRDLPFSHQLIWSNDHNNNHINNHINSDNHLSEDLNNNNISYDSFNKRRSLATIEALEALRNDHKYCNGFRGDQWTVRSRTPPVRRSAVPDIVKDDFAFRKYNKCLSHSYLSSKPEITGFNSIKRINNNKDYSLSYLLMTSSMDDIYYHNDNRDSVYTNDLDLKHLSKANIKTDDLSVRRIRQSPAFNVMPPHPPFGIPNNVLTQSSVNDYIRAEKDPKVLSKVRFRCKSSVPHLIHDDMAFRSLRKENKCPMNPIITENNKSMPDLSISSSRV